MSTLKTTNIAHPSSASNNIVLDSSGNVVLQAGSASTPALQPSGDTNTGIFFPAADTIAFAEGGAEAARIDSSGRLLVGTSSTSSVTTLLLQGYSGTTGPGVLRCCTTTSGPSSAEDLGYLAFGDATHVSAAWILAQRDGGTWTAGSSHPGRLVFSTTADGASSPTERLRISNAGNFGFNTTTLTGKYNFDGSIYLFTQASGAGTNALRFNTSTGAVTYDTSSRLIKENIEPCPYGIAEIKQLQPRKYFRTDDQKDEIGFIADEVVEILPEFVPLAKKSTLTHNKEDTEIIPIAVNYEKLTAVLTKALQEAIERIETLEAKVAVLEAS